MDPADTIPVRHVTVRHPEIVPLSNGKYGLDSVDDRHLLCRHLVPVLCLQILIVTLASPPVLHATDIYKWTDEQGRVHYGDRPGAEKVIQITTTKGPAPDPAQGRRQQQQRQLLEVFEEDRLKVKQARADEKQARETRLVNCNTARTRLTEMQNARFIYEESMDPVNPLILSEQETAEALASASHDVDLWCTPPPK